MEASRKQDNSKPAGFEKRQKRRKIKALQDAIKKRDIGVVRSILSDNELEIDFQYRGQTSLQMAVHEGHVDICKCLIDKGASVNVCDVELNNLLNMASWRGYPSVVQLLLQHNANIDDRNEHGITPFHAAVIRGHSNIVKMLIDAGCNFNITNDRVQTPLYTAVKYNFISIVDILINCKSLIDSADEDIRTPLLIASDMGHAEIVSLLIKGAANMNKKDRYNRTPLYCAASRGHKEIVEILLEAEADPNIAVTNGSTPLLEAIRHNHSDVAKALLDSGCDVNQCDRLHQSPLHAAVRQMSLYFGHHTEELMTLVRKLVGLCCDVNAADRHGLCPLYQSAMGGDFVLTNFLLDNKAKISPVTDEGETMLHGGVYGNSLPVIKILIKAGCDINKQNKKGEHALYSAVAAKTDFEIIKCLVGAGADLNLQENSEQKTPLHCAIIEHNTKAANLLIKSGCDLNLANNKLQTSLYIACEKGNEDIVSYLLEQPGCRRVALSSSVIPLHAAVLKGYFDIISTLIEADCNINQMNDSCLTPIQVAVAEDNLEIAKLLLLYGCDLNAHARIKHIMKCCLLHDDVHPHFDLEPLFFATTHKNLELIELLLKCYYHIPFRTVKFIKMIMQTTREMASHYSMEMRKRFDEIFNQVLSEPRLLQELCRNRIRECLGVNPQQKVKWIPLAAKLKDYILMTDLIRFEEKSDVHARQYRWL